MTTDLETHSSKTRYHLDGPGSTHSQMQERNLVRYLERLYQSIERDPKPSSTFGVCSNCGPVSEQTHELMASHYDTPFSFFECFLDRDYLAYSMAYFGETPEEIRASTMDLEQAQERKFSLISQRAEISGNEHILNIGCGFGSLETYLLSRYPNLRITGITGSRVQSEYLAERIANKSDPFHDRFCLIYGDFSHLDLEDIGLAKYDLVTSIGVFEHVFNLRGALRRISELVKKNGRSFHHLITSKYAVPRFLSPTDTRIGNYFPGGRIWPREELKRYTEDFVLLSSWDINGLNYYRTLELWHERFWSSLPKLKNVLPDVGAIKFWNEYFLLCKAVFAPLQGEFCGNSQYLFGKRN
ncbi:MAG: class I SAM-dependent methyltransferase [Gammaproteobacteria bacterium]|nr:class I SAM-dependent methyltransferase [Gammaproteobacteria bacterium]MDH5692724.1 class I SAM-dependent methyltransferase [Gammaproteobacteria bacterium]